MRPRYSLRLLLFCVAAIAVALGIWTRRSLEQSRLVRRAEFAQFRIEYGPAPRMPLGLISNVLERIETAVGKDWLRVPIEARVKSSGAGEYADDFRDLCALRTLRRIDLTGSPTDDDALSAIAGLAHLEVLMLSGTLVTDVGLTSLEPCAALRELSLGYTLVSEDTAKTFESRHPHCHVSRADARDCAYVESQRWLARSSDRLPTADEKRKLDLAIRLLQEHDKQSQFDLSNELWPQPHPAGIPEPKPGTQAFRQRELHILSRPDEIYLESAARLLGELGFAEAIPHLQHIVVDTSRPDGVRCLVIRPLSHIADTRIIPILINLLDDSSPDVARSAWIALTLSTGARFDDEGLINNDFNLEFRRNLKARWQRYWQQNRDIIRPRRAPTFGDLEGGF